jgi:hypothetical protein
MIECADTCQRVRRATGARHARRLRGRLRVTAVALVGGEAGVAVRLVGGVGLARRGGALVGQCLTRGGRAPGAPVVGVLRTLDRSSPPTRAAAFVA